STPPGFSRRGWSRCLSVRKKLPSSPNGSGGCVKPTAPAEPRRAAHRTRRGSPPGRARTPCASPTLVVGRGRRALRPQALQALRLGVHVRDGYAEQSVNVLRPLQLGRPTDGLEHEPAVEEAEILVAAELELGVRPGRLGRISRRQADDL